MVTYSIVLAVYIGLMTAFRLWKGYNKAKQKDALLLSNTEIEIKCNKRTILTITEYSKQLNNIHKFNEKYSHINMN